MNIEAVLSDIDKLIYTKTGKHLTTLQTTIFRGAWLGQKYEEIAQSCYCSDIHIKMVGAELWELVSVVLKERVTKKTFRAALERNKMLLSTDMLELASPSIPIPQDLELPDGQVKLGSKFYIYRPPIESFCFQNILQPGCLIRIKAPRQMGKTSLMRRILHYAQFQGCNTVCLNFQLGDRKIWKDTDQFLRWFCVNVGRELQLPNKLADYWDDLFGSKMSCRDYFNNYLLAQSEKPLVLALDEADSLFQYPEIADDFFAFVRSWYEEAKNLPVVAKMRLILVHSTEAYTALQIHQSPLNFGLPVELPEFLPEQVLDLACRHGLQWHPVEVEKLMAMIGGHPYLLRVALYHLANQDITLKHLLQSATTESGLYSNHLRRHLGQLEQQPQLVDALRTVVEATSPIRLYSMEVFKLYSLGLVRLNGNEVVPRCELYRQYFREHLVR